MSSQLPVLFVHAAGDPSEPDGSGRFIDHLARALGSGYDLHAPTMPNPDEPHHRPWADRIDQELRTIGIPVIAVGHSFGGSVLMKYLAEETSPVAVRGLFLVAVPFWGPGGWEYEEYNLPDDFAVNLPPAPIYLYQSRDDPSVSFDHLGLWSAKLPHATKRPLPGAEHSFLDGLPELVEDIKGLHDVVTDPAR